MSDETTLLPCPFCGGEAHMSASSDGYGVQCWNRRCMDIQMEEIPTEAEAIAAWNARTLSILSAKQVREAIYKNIGANPYNVEYYTSIIDHKAIADELNSELGSDAKPCYAADENYKRCKYSVNRGWCDDAPFLVWDDTGHLFITMGGLKTWDVTDDAKKWFAELGSGTCEQVLTDCDDGLMPPFTAHCSACGAEWGFTPKFCHNCGAKVTGTRDERKAVER